MKVLLLSLFFISRLSFASQARLTTEAASCSLMKATVARQATLKIRVIFGYKDARPARYVGDRHERLAFVDRIAAPCTDDQDACGFFRSRYDADVFTKSALISGHHMLVQLSVVNSSVGSDDEENRKDPFQIWKGQNAQRTFLEGLRDADVVFYNGHSRFGGGPDFHPPLLDEAGSVDPRFYQSSRLGIKRVVDVLETARGAKAEKFGHLKLLGLYSCSSSQHFETTLRRATDAGLIFSNQLVYYSDALQQSLAALNDVLSNRCPRAVAFR